MPNKYLKDFNIQPGGSVTGAPPIRVTKRKLDKVKNKQTAITARGQVDPLGTDFIPKTPELDDKIDALTTKTDDMIRSIALAASQKKQDFLTEKRNNLLAKKSKLQAKRTKQRETYAAKKAEVDEAVETIEDIFWRQVEQNGLEDVYGQKP